MCAQGNMTVALPSTPASYFHLLRRQLTGDRPRPLVVFTPKSILRLKAAASHPEEFTAGGFQPVIDDPDLGSREGVRRVALCSGKVYYDLASARRRRKVEHVALVRVEQLYPLPGEDVAATLDRYGSVDVAWVQEEPANMGAWPHVALGLPEHLGNRTLRRISRPASASPSAGSSTVHEAEQQALLDAVFAD